MECAVNLTTNTHLSLQGGNKSDRCGNPLHAMNASRQYGSDFVKQWIATGYTLAITRYRKEGHPMKS